MTLIPLEKSKINDQYNSLYNQTGNGANIPIYRGGSVQRGYGLGSIFSGLVKSAIPLLKSGAKSLGKTALKTGLNVARDAIEGKNIKQAFTDNLQQAGSETLDNLIDTVSKSSHRKKRTNKRRMTSNDSAIPKKKRRKNTPTKTKDIFS